MKKRTKKTSSPGCLSETEYYRGNLLVLDAHQSATILYCRTVSTLDGVPYYRACCELGRYSSKAIAAYAVEQILDGARFTE
jgi:hypothetical protein